MSKMEGLQQALKSSSGKAVSAPTAQPREQARPDTVSAPSRKPPSREGKEYTGAWLNSDFGTALRMVQLRKRKDAQGRKVYLDDLIAEALNDLFIKYDVPTVHHD